MSFRADPYVAPSVHRFTHSRTHHTRAVAEPRRRRSLSRRTADPRRALVGPSPAGDPSAAEDGPPPADASSVFFFFSLLAQLRTNCLAGRSFVPWRSSHESDRRGGGTCRSPCRITKFYACRYSPPPCRPTPTPPAALHISRRRTRARARGGAPPAPPASTTSGRRARRRAGWTRRRTPRRRRRQSTSASCRCGPRGALARARRRPAPAGPPRTPPPPPAVGGGRRRRRKWREGSSWCPCGLEDQEGRRVPAGRSRAPPQFWASRRGGLLAGCAKS